MDSRFYPTLDFIRKISAPLNRIKSRVDCIRKFLYRKISNRRASLFEIISDRRPFFKGKIGNKCSLMGNFFQNGSKLKDPGFLLKVLQ